MSFKLIAIRPLKGCNEKFRKNLIPNQIYKFYNEYEFLDENDKEIKCTENFVEVSKIVKKENNVPEGFYYQGNTKINISAIVGKNGSGKSSLIELICVAFYNLSVKAKLINDIEVDDKKNRRLRKQVRHLEGVITGLQYDLGETQISQLTDEEIDEKEAYIEFYTLLKNEQEKNIRNKIIKREIVEDIKLNIYFVQKNENNSDEKVVTISFNNDKIYFFESKINEFVKKEAEVKEITQDSSLNELFYNIIVNYSFYGLNSTDVDDWIETIFHKNDGYQTPIVLNPMRTEGNIDINTENSLTKQRFLYNLTKNSDLLQVTPTNKIDKVILKLKKYDKKDFLVSISRGDNMHPTYFFEKIILKNFYKYSESEIFIKDNELNIILMKYILKKLIRIRETYEIYNDCSAFYDENFSIYRFSKDYNQFFEMLREDNSHITYKVKQALNFLFFNNLKISEFENDIYRKFSSTSEGRFTIDEISCGIKNKSKLDRFYKVKKSNEDIFHLPPSIFEIDYVFENGSSFSYLSSGEKQFIYSVNSILYHLTNLNSTYENETINKYKFLNLILDEIELYSHPEMQKKFVNSLLEGISKLSINNIQGLNILFITHSPFILSDIPKENVLFLDNGKPQDFNRKNTFGANIIDLLADSFFLKDGLMGDFAKEKIEATINWLNEERKNKQNKSEKSYDLNLKDYEYHKKIVQLIDEPILRMKLAEMLDELQDSRNLQKEVAQKEIDFLKNKFGL
jgi:predicted ATPase